jgi:hypothetical protein
MSYYTSMDWDMLRRIHRSDWAIRLMLNLHVSGTTYILSPNNACFRQGLSSKSQNIFFPTTFGFLRLFSSIQNGPIPLICTSIQQAEFVTVKSDVTISI